MMIPKVRMTMDRVLVKMTPLETTTPSGLIIPQLDKRGEPEKRSSSGEVLAVGPDCKEVQVGDVVLFDPLSGRDWVEGTTVIPEENLLAIVPAGVTASVKDDQQRRRA